MGLLQKATDYRKSEENKENLGKMVKYGNLIADLYDAKVDEKATDKEKDFQKIYEKAFMYYARKSPIGESMGQRYLNMYNAGLR